MVRALASLIIVCLVAATGVCPAAAAQDARSSMAPRTVAVLHARTVEVFAGPGAASGSGDPRFRRASSGSPAFGPPGFHPVVPIAADRFALQPPAPRSTERAAHRSSTFALRSLSTRSARGPPVA